MVLVMLVVLVMFVVMVDGWLPPHLYVGQLDDDALVCDGQRDKWCNGDGVDPLILQTIHPSTLLCQHSQLLFVHESHR